MPLRSGLAGIIARILGDKREKPDKNSLKKPTEGKDETK